MPLLAAICTAANRIVIRSPRSTRASSVGGIFEAKGLGGLEVDQTEFVDEDLNNHPTGLYWNQAV